MTGRTSDGLNSQSNEVSLREVLLKLGEWYKYLLQKRNLILIVGLVGSLAGFFYAWSKKPVYIANLTFVLEDQTAGGSLGQYAGLASIVGIDVGRGENGIFQGDNIFELYKSRSMIEKTLLTSTSFSGHVEKLIDRYIRFNKLRETWGKNENLKKINFSIDKNQFTKTHDSVITAIVRDINSKYLSVDKPDKKLSIIAVSVKSPDEEFSKAFTEKLVENVNEFYIRTKTKKSIENIAILKNQADSVRRILNSSITGVASSIDANPNANPALQILQAPSQRKQIDIQANSAIYAEVVKNLEVSKIAMRRETPLIQIIDRPVLPLEIEHYGRLKWAAIGGLLTTFLIVFILISRLIIKSVLLTEVKS